MRSDKRIEVALGDGAARASLERLVRLLARQAAAEHARALRERAARS